MAAEPASRKLAREGVAGKRKPTWPNRSIREDRNALHAVLQPPGWPQPKGYANGIKARGEIGVRRRHGRLGRQGSFRKGFVAQAKLALENIAAVLAEGGAAPEHIVRLTWYVRDMDEYLAACRSSAPPIAR